MKNTKKNKRIPRTLIPSNPQKSILTGKDLQFFNRTQVSFKILEKPQKIQTQQKNITFDKIFKNIISSKLAQLCKPKRNYLNSTDYSKTFHSQSKKDHNKSLRTTRTLSKKDQQQFNLQLLNINKTINGTRLGALSDMKILQQLDIQYIKQNQLTKHQQSQSFRKIDSDIVQQLDQKSVTFQLPGLRRLSQMYKKKSQITGPKTQQRLLNLIYSNDQSFIEKNRDYQMLLMQRIPTYKSRHMTLDYKNDWKI